MINKLRKSEFLRYIVILMSGTMVAQLINLGLSVVLYKYFYSPVEAAEWGLFSRIIAVGAALATARYEFALPVAKANVHSFRLYHVALRTSVIVALVSSVLALIPIAMSGNWSDVLFYALIPLGLFLTAFYSIGTNWAIRNKKYRGISYSKVANNGIGGGFKLLFGWMGFGYIGLIVGTVLGLIVANLWFVRDFLDANKIFRIKSRSPRNMVLARHFDEFPKINLPHVMMDLGRDLLFAMLVIDMYGKEIFGLYDHSYRMLRMPLMLAGLAISQVFFQRCAEKYNNGEDIFPMVFKSVKVLFLISIVPFTLVFFYGDELFAWVFSETWRGAGEHSQIMSIWFMLNFIASPISFLPLVLRKQRVFFLIAVFGAVSMIGSLIIPHYFFDADFTTSLWIVTASQVVYFLFIIFKTFQFVRQSRPSVTA